MTQTAEKTNKLIINSIQHIELDPIFSEEVRNKIQAVGKAASKIPVRISEESEALAAEEVIKEGKKLAKTLEEIRKTFSAPLDEKKKQLMALERSVLEPATKAVELLTKSVNAYHNERAKIAREAARLLQEQTDARMRRMTNISNIAALQQKTEEAIADVAAPTAGTRKVKKYAVTHLELVPRDLLMIDDSKVQAMLKQGIMSCAGLEIYEEIIRSGR